MRQDDRAPFVEALHRARQQAFAPGAFVGQESFMTADEIRQLAGRAAIGIGDSVLDVCCGIAGPGRLIVAERGCRYLGVDYSAGALTIARALAADLPCDFVAAHVPPLPTGHFDVVLLLETMLAFPDKRALVGEVARALPSGGRFAFTVEAGHPLSRAERSRMPDADTVHLVEHAELTTILSDAGLSVTWEQDLTEPHRTMARALAESFGRHRADIVQAVGHRALEDLITAHEQWLTWLCSGRVRKYAVVARKA